MIKYLHPELKDQQIQRLDIPRYRQTNVVAVYNSFHGSNSRAFYSKAQTSCSI
jgi:hypothetical protein